MGESQLVQIYRKAASGDTGAMVEYARHLMEGDGCRQNQKGAVQCLAHATEKGNAVAATQLGMCYAYGTGVEKNERKALECYRRGAELGDAESMYRLFENLSIGTGCAVNTEEADKWLEKAMNAGSGKATAIYKRMNNSGLLNSSLKEAAQKLHKLTEIQANVDNDQSYKKNIPVSDLDIERIPISDPAEDKVISQEFTPMSQVKNSMGMIIIYIITGVISGFLLKSAFVKGVYVFNSGSLYSQLDSIDGIVLYLAVLGGIVGLAAGLIMTFIHKKLGGILCYIPVLAFPLILLLIGPVMYPVLKAIGTLLYTLFSIIVTLIGLWCSIGSSNS